MKSNVPECQHWSVGQKLWHGRTRYTIISYVGRTVILAPDGGGAVQSLDNPYFLRGTNGD